MLFLLAELEAAGKVILAGEVSLSQLKTFYQLAHVYLCQYQVKRRVKADSVKTIKPPDHHTSSQGTT